MTKTPAAVAGPIDEPPAAARDAVPAGGDAHGEVPAAGKHDAPTIVHEAVVRVEPPEAVAAPVDEPPAESVAAPVDEPPDTVVIEPPAAAAAPVDKTPAAVAGPIDEPPAAIATPVDEPQAAARDAVHAAGEAHDESPKEGEHDGETQAAAAAPVDEPPVAARDAVHTAAGEAHGEAPTAGEHGDSTPYGRKGHGGDEDDSVKHPVGDHSAQAQSKKGFDVQLASPSFEDLLMSSFCNLLMCSQQASVTAQFFYVQFSSHNDVYRT